MKTKPNKSKSDKFKSNKMRLIITLISSLVLLTVVYSINRPSAEKVVDGDIVIPISGISETATFYSAEINGTDIEVLAVKAPDGTLRTAFNTCQVCYSSGKGYYVQEGDMLICQNCRNQFVMDQVEISVGGCNPVPITAQYKTIDDSSITISKDFLAEATVIFKNWK
jgi:uncharacterized membrane protein